MSAAKIPAAVVDLFAGKAIANLATVSAEGQPLVTPVWIDREGDCILVNSTKGRVKNRNMKKGAKVALSVTDPANPMRYVAVQGKVVEVRGHDVADKHLDSLAQRYIGKSYPWRQPGDLRELFVIEPSHVKVQG